MTESDDSNSGAETTRESGPQEEFLYFFPDAEVTRAEVEGILAEGSEEKKAWVVSHLLRYAQWDDIWEFVSRDEVRRIFTSLDLPDNLRQAWGRMLKIEAEVG